MKRIMKVGLILLALLSSALLGAFFFYLGATGGARLDPAKLELKKETVQVFDALGQEIAQDRGAAVGYAEFPACLPQAFVAVEDKRFYDHKGVDLLRIGKASLKNLFSLSFREGASTISQQLIKNTHLSSEKTLSRKLKEIKLTRALEKNYSKDEIMELYLNSIYFGHSAFGIAKASDFYFGKKTAELSPADCALLAALVKSPNRFSPFRDPEKCLSRRNFVLGLMHEQGYLTDSEYALACAEPLPASPHADRSGSSYLSYLYAELAELFPDAGTGELSSLKVYSAYDPALQKKLESIDVESDATMIVASVKTRAIKALRATAGVLKRSPASVIKPLLVYAPALEEKLISPATPLSDERADFGGYSPDDAGGASGGYVSAREALARSVNIPSVRLLNALGPEKGASYLEKMGIRVEKEDLSLALALGGMKEGFRLDELIGGYLTLANRGTYAQCGAIERVENDKGKILYERKPSERRVFSEETAFLAGDMLETAAREGTAKKLKNLPYFVAAKTGTNESEKGNLDAYTIAYTAEDIAGVWMGNADMSPVACSGGGAPASAVKEIFEFLYSSHTPARPQAPKGVERRSFDLEEYTKNHKIILSDELAPVTEKREEYFATSNLPAEISTRFSHPTIQTPRIQAKNGTVTIVLCQTEYYDYLVKRRDCGQEITVYSGPYCETICDNSVVAGKNYTYIVTPLYKGNAGEPVELPRIRIQKNDDLPGDWWDD